MTQSIDDVGSQGVARVDRDVEGETVQPLGGQVRHKRKPSAKRRLIEWGVILLVAVSLAFVVRTSVLETFYIPSGSMEPTLMIGDRILVDKLSFQLGGKVATGDIVVFKRPPWANVGPPNIKYLVKRVIGLPGQTVSSHGGQVYIDGKLLKEPFLPKGTITQGIKTQTIPKNHYFVMGDNRPDSEDSRFFGPIPGSLIVGKVVARIWPLSRFKIF
ncbi:MAG: signal peptidase I [Actinobacteria bacterium]|nr:signal peptidase I [Actinomycetota bacterium]